MYPVELTIPMSKDLTDFGFQGLTSPQEVKNTIENTEEKMSDQQLADLRAYIKHRALQ